MIANFRKKTKKTSLPNRIFLKLAVILFLLLLILLSFANIGNYRKRNKLISQIKTMEEKISGIKAENDRTEQNIQKVNDDSYVEKVAREELDLQKPGEKVYSFIRTTEREEQNSVKENISQGWLGWIGGAWNWVKSWFK